MSRRLAELQVGTLRMPSTRQRRGESVTQAVPTAPPVQEPIQQMTELVYLQQIPGIQPFLTPDLFIDLVYILRRDGLNNLLSDLYPIPDVTGIVLEPAAIPENVTIHKLRQKAVLEAFQMGGLGNAINQILFPDDLPIEESPEISRARNEYLENIYQRGAQELSNMIQAADPANPASIIFNHDSQKVHQRTQQIEIELIKNQPEVIEKEDVQCQCGSRKIQMATKQLRRADEPPTLFYRCVTCNKRWQTSAA